MSDAIIQRIGAALAQFSSVSRLYELHLDGGADDEHLLVEAFAATDALQETGARDVIALSTSACLAPASLLGRQATLAVSLRVIYLGGDEKYRYAHNDQQHDEGKDRQYAGTSGDDELARSA